MEMNSVIHQHCCRIHEQAASLTEEQLKASLDLFASEMGNLHNYNLDIISIKEIVSALTNLSYKTKWFSNSKFITHPIFVVLRDCILVDYLHARERNNEGSNNLVAHVAALFGNICFHVNNSNAKVFKELFYSRKLVDEITECLVDIAIHDKYTDHSFVHNTIGSLLKAYCYFNKLQTAVSENSATGLLSKTIVECLCSPYSIKMVKRLENNFSQSLTPAQMLLHSQCPLYLKWRSTNQNYSTNEDFQYHLQMPRTLLSPFREWIATIPSYLIVHCSEDIGKLLRHLSFPLIRPVDWRLTDTSNQEFYDDYCRLASYWLSCLSSLVNNIVDNANFYSTERFILQTLYDFSLQENMLSFMKAEKDLIPLLLKMSDIQDDEAKLNVFRCLGKLMNEKDIKAMSTANHFANVHMKFLSARMDHPNRTQRCYSIIKSLKSFVHHDQVKAELIKAKAVPLLMQCIIDDSFDSAMVKTMVLEVLLALSFDNEASQTLLKSTDFKRKLRSFVMKENSPDSKLQRAAETLQWKLEKEHESVSASANSKSYKYDIMISYSHSDRYLCYQIHERLIQDGFNVWIDREKMYETTMAAMAEAIENSEFVLICMSNNYKESVYCQSEAHYAFERNCDFIPILMKDSYKPDGWLGIMVSSKVYIHFTDAGFTSAYEKLIKAINQHRRSRGGSGITNSMDYTHSNNANGSSGPAQEVSTDTTAHSTMIMLSNSIALPQNIMELKNAQFFDFVKQYSGEKVAALLKFQDINSVDCFLYCKDPFEILSLDSNDLLDLKKEICIKLSNNSHTILPGVKCKLNLLREALMIHSNQLKKNWKTSSSVVISKSFSTTDSIINNNSNDTENLIFVPSSMNESTLTNHNLRNEEGIRRQIIQSLNDWCEKTKEKNGSKIFQLTEKVDYEVFVDTLWKRVLVKCYCGKTITLSQKDNTYVLSSYCRHLTHRNPCSLVQEKLGRLCDDARKNANSKFEGADVSTDVNTNKTSNNAIPGVQLSIRKRQRTNIINPSVVTKKKK